MLTILSDTTPVARKDYPCDVCKAMKDAGIKEEYLNEEQLKLYNEAKEDDFMIKKGQKYEKQVNIYEREIGTFRSRLGMRKVYFQLELNEDF